MACFFKNGQFSLSTIKEIMVLGKPLDKFGKQEKKKNTLLKLTLSGSIGIMYIINHSTKFLAHDCLENSSLVPTLSYMQSTS